MMRQGSVDGRHYEQRPHHALADVQLMVEDDVDAAGSVEHVGHREKRLYR